jgi:UbiD family decarboxylase
VPFDDLRAFMRALEARGELVRVREPVSPEFEIGLICKKLNDARGPAALFEGIPGSPMPVLANLFPTRQRVALALGIDERDLIPHWLDCLQRPVEPTLVAEGPCQEVVIEAPDLTALLPRLIWHPQDGGPMITLGMSICRDPDSGIRNLGLYRLQMQGGDRLGFNSRPPQHAGVAQAKAEARGEPLEVAVVMGGDPALYLASQAVGSYELDELALAGAFRNAPVPLVKCKTVDLEVPATAEIVLEGEVLPNVREMEGPFGEFTGYYSAAAPRGVMRVKAMTRRTNPIYLGTYEGKPPVNTHVLQAVAREPIFFADVRRSVCPTVKDLVVTEAGCASLHVIVSIKQLRAGQARNVGFELIKSNLVKHVVVVDEDIDVRDPAAVEWAIATRVQGAKDILVAPRTAGMPLDPSQYDFPSGLGDKVIVDATRSFGHHEELIEFPPELEAAVAEKWGRYGFAPAAGTAPR